MSVGKSSIDLLKEKANNARDTKECIIYMVESNDKIHNKLEIMDKNAKEQISKKPIDKFHFDSTFDEKVQPIVLRKQEKSKDDELYK